MYWSRKCIRRGGDSVIPRSLWWCQQMRAHKRTIDCCDTACVLSCVHSHSHIHSLPAKSLLLGNLSNFMSVQLTLPSRRDPSSSHSPCDSNSDSHPSIFYFDPTAAASGGLHVQRRTFIGFSACLYLFLYLPKIPIKRHGPWFGVDPPSGLWDPMESVYSLSGNRVL